MATSLGNFILAVITMDRNRVGGGAPVFYANSQKELQEIAATLERTIDGMAHEVTADTLIIIKHS
ncbi:capping complex subunit for YIEGIA [Aneurinibacillus tyrosinisolvens]|jgi:hypothetical protein|uniref:capping complex subunit for YIEGIA n=1 Tax=Aneurinibacillus tyrosinisolvens TaxID=1443435 RepID=UPI00063F6209|nr:hypothetical protein [Aneurinibacillus tyrosinisolvens]